MRRLVAGHIMAAIILLAGCSDQSNQVTSPEDLPDQFAVVPAPGCTSVPSPSQVIAAAQELIPLGSLRTTVVSGVQAVPTNVPDRLRERIQSRILPMQDLIFQAFYAGQLSGGTSTATFDEMLDLSTLLHCLVGLTPPNYPSTTSGADVVVGVFFPTTPTTTLVVPSEHAALTVPQGAAPEGGVTVVISILPDAPPPLLTSLDQYPLFYEFEGMTPTGPVTFELDVTAGICLGDNFDVSDANLRLAHNVGPNFGDVEVLPRPAVVPGLDCSDLGESGEIGAAAESGRGTFAFWGDVRRVLTPLADALLPERLHATSLVLATTGVGGTTRKFSPFGIVDIFSNPGAFAPLDPEVNSEEAGSTVSRSVRVTSENGEPIANVPVVFETENGTLSGGSPQTVLTDANGEAAVSWTLPGDDGAYTLTASVPAIDQPPEGIEPPGGNTAFFPDVAFDPTTLTFTVTVGPPIIL